ncbi:MAG: phenylalanyl-tRNA synthetase beta chain [Alphaproteobacteria bacterium]|jgi:phenylalanyl-tRNA synthetase beta chain
MKFSLSWLKQHLETEATAEVLAARMVSLGLEVEGIEDEGAQFNNVVVGNIVTRVQHPDADRLGVCTVNVGAKENLQIVCGAPNARDDLKVVVATDGAVLPGDFVIKPSKLRGVKSNGMICSIKELGFGEEADGIWEFDGDVAIGTPIAEALGQNDVVFDVDMTPNRGDALSVYGVARDLAASGMGTLNAVTVEEVDEGVDVDDAVENTEAPSIVKTHAGCPFFTGQLITDVENGESPTWMKKFLEQAGLRSINCLADITNFMLMSYGQPMHVYDADKLKGDLRIEAAKGGEKLLGLDGNEHTLAEGDIAIMDDSGVIGLAGIVGGESTSVDENTKNVYLEVAQFNKENVAVTGQRLQCNTDARYRFERGIDAGMTVPVAVMASDLIVELCGGHLGGIDTDGEELPEVREITFNPVRVKTFGGLDIPAAEVKEILENLGFTVKGTDIFNVTVPSYCTMMDTDADLIEEVLRMKGLDVVPTQLPPLPLQTIKGADSGRKADRIARRSLAAMGYLECINYSFINREKAQLFAEGEALLELANPLDEAEMSTMRPSLIPSLLDAASKNMARGESSIHLGEVGKTYTETTEVLKASGLIMGGQDKHWQGNAKQTDLFTAKADAISMLESLGVAADKLQVRKGANSAYHPGRSGSLVLGKNVFATFGEVHPAVMKNFGLKGTAVIFEVDLLKAENMQMKKPAFVSSTYQAVQRDLAFLVESDVQAGDLINALKGADKDLVRHVNLFDVYEGENVEAGKKSVALSMTLQAVDRTLTEADINAVVEKAVGNVKKRFNAEVR